MITFKWFNKHAERLQALMDLFHADESDFEQYEETVWTFLKSGKNIKVLDKYEFRDLPESFLKDRAIYKSGDYYCIVW